jgi:hypothetical protein
MNRELLKIQQGFFSPKTTKRDEIEKWIKDVNQSKIKSIYDLTWKAFYKELQDLGVKKFLNQYGYLYKQKLHQAIAKSGLSEKKLSLYDFEVKREHELLDRLGASFFDKISPYPNFNPKNHLLSTIHHYLYDNNLNFTALSLGFSNKQTFLNFFAQTLYVSDCIGTKAKNLRMSIQSLHAVDPVTLRKELGELYDKPLLININFIKYNYTLEELKLALECEDTALVVASLGGGNLHAINKKLQTLRPLINVNLRALKIQSWESLKKNTPIFIWKVKLYQLFSGQMPKLSSFRSWGLYTPYANFLWQFFTSYPPYNANEQEGIPLQFSNLYSSLY